MRIFLDANILFSVAKSDGAIRQLLRHLQSGQHTLVTDSYVQSEAVRNIAAKANADAISDLEALLCEVEVNAVQFGQLSSSLQSAALWLPEKDRPVLLVTGDSTHFGPSYGKCFEGVTVCSPRQLAELVKRV